MEKHDEQEITSLLTAIRSKRDLSSFANTNQKKNGKATTPIPIILEEAIELKIEESTQNTVREDSYGEGEIIPKKERLKTAHSKVIRSEMGEKLDLFLKSAQEAEAGEQYSFAHNKRHYLDDDLFQTLVLLKNTGRICSISILVNVVVSQFLDAHQTDIEALLHKSNKRK